MFLDKNNTENDANSLFEGINTEPLKQFFNPKNVIGKKEGDIIYQKGDPTEYMYLVLDGSIKLKLTEPDGTNIIIQKEKHNFFGETELLIKSSRKSSAVADTDCRLIAINMNELKALIKADRKILQNLYSNKTFELSNEEIIETNKHFPIIDLKIDDLSSTTEKFSIDTLPEEPDESIPYADPGDEDNALNITKSDIEISEPLNNFSNHKENNEENITKDTDESISFSELLGEDEGVETNISLDFPQEKNEEIVLPDKTENSEESSFIQDDDSIIIDEKIPAEEEQVLGFDDIGFSDTIERLPEVPLKETYVSDFVEETVLDKIEAKEEMIQSPVYYNKIIKTIEKIFSKTSLDSTSDIIAEAACDLLNAGGGVLYLLNSDHSVLNAKVLIENSIESIKLKTEGCLQGLSVKGKKNIIVNNPASEEYFSNPVANKKGIKPHNALYFPILSKQNEVKALLELFNSEKGSFTSKDIELLEVISPAILQAIQNSQLVEINQNQYNISSIGNISNFLTEDLKNPLLIIKHYANSLKKKNIPDDVKKILDLQIKEVNASEDFLKGTLSFVHKKNILEMKSVSLTESLNEIIDLLAEYVESRNNVIFKKLDADATVNIDIRQFFIACYQIVKNACDTMPDDGKIFITTESDGDYIKVKIKDHGIGIPESRKSDIFKPFTSWGKKHHAGLGLSIADKIISDHGGYILLDSAVGSGSTFILALPVIF